MTREEIDRVIEEGGQVKELLETEIELPLMFNTRLAESHRGLLAAVKQLRDENADLTNRLTDAQDFINYRIEKGRR